MLLLHYTRRTSQHDAASSGHQLNTFLGEPFACHTLTCNRGYGPPVMACPSTTPPWQQCCSLHLLWTQAVALCDELPTHPFCKLQVPPTRLAAGQHTMLFEAEESLACTPAVSCRATAVHSCAQVATCGCSFQVQFYLAWLLLTLWQHNLEDGHSREGVSCTPSEQPLAVQLGQAHHVAHGTAPAYCLAGHLQGGRSGTGRHACWASRAPHSPQCNA